MTGIVTQPYANCPIKVSNSNESIGSGLAFGITAALIWGGWPVLTRLGLNNSLNIFDITALRYIIAGILLLPFFLKRRFKGVSFMGAFVIFIGAGAPYLLTASAGLNYASAAHFGVIAPSSMLVFTTIFSRLILGDRITKVRLMGLGIIIAGILVMAWEGFLVVQGDEVWIGDLLFVAGGLFWSIYTVAGRYWHVEPMHSISIVAVFSMFAFLPPYLIFSGPALLNAPPLELLGHGLYQGVFSAFIALLLYTRAVKIMGPARGAVFAALVPGFALILAIPVLGDIPTILQVTGVILVTTGMFFALGLVQPRISKEKALQS